MNHQPVIWGRWVYAVVLFVVVWLGLSGCGRDREAEATATAEAGLALAATQTAAAHIPVLQPTFTPTAASDAGGRGQSASTTPAAPPTITSVQPTPSPTATLPVAEQLQAAQYLYRIGDYAAAETSLRALLPRLHADDPQWAEAQYLLARTYLAVDNYTDAVTQLQSLQARLGQVADIAGPEAVAASANAAAATGATASIANSGSSTATLTLSATPVTATTTTTVTAGSANPTITATDTASSTVATTAFSGTVAISDALQLTTSRPLVNPLPTPEARPETAVALAAQADYLQAVALRSNGEPTQAIAAYWRFLEVYPWMGEFVQPQIAAAYLALGDSNGAATAYRRAADAATDRVAKARLLESLANVYREAGQYGAAVKAYEEILALAQNAAYRAEIQYLAGQAHAGAGNLPAAIERWQAATEEEPSAGAAYRALIELVNRNVPFDLYQRGYIDLQAGALLPAINAYEAYLNSVDTTDSRVGAALAGMGRAYLLAENYAAAIATLDQVIANHEACPCLGDAWLDKAAALTAQGDAIGARRTYRTFAREYPDDPLAPEALWRSGLQALNTDNHLEAAADLLRLADAFPESERAPLALFIVGFGAYERGLPAESVVMFERLQETYPDYNRTGVAFWLGRGHQAEGKRAQAQAEWQALVDEAPDSYYGILAAQSLQGLPLVAGNWLNAMTNVAGPVTTLADDNGSRAYAEEWLAEWLELSPATVAQLPDAVAAETDLQVGELLLMLDQRGDALAALERVYTRHSTDPHALYALSLTFEELGAYRLSIISMARLLELSPAELVEDAPIFLQKRVYPQHFADLITAEALAQGINPLLYFSLIRQESLFEEGARSFAAAQGLAQIIPDTGLWVAERLGHPEYTNEIIYRPHINLQFGAYYLAWARDYLDGNIISALVGYNAGPGNAEFWRDVVGADDTLFVELLTVSEPRIYVQAITMNLYHYTRLY